MEAVALLLEFMSDHNQKLEDDRCFKSMGIARALLAKVYDFCAVEADHAQKDLRT